MEFTINLNEEFLNNFSRIMSGPTRTDIFFDKEDFAPGVWAGTEGAILTFGNSRFQIKKVNFEYRCLECNNETI